MSRQFRKIFEPITIGNIDIKNRVAMAPMGTMGLLDRGGIPGQRALDYYIERARGGVGLIITGTFKVENEIDQFSDRNFPMISPETLSPLAELTESVHALGTRIFVQLTAGFGRVINPLWRLGQPVSASAIPYYWDPIQNCRALEMWEVEKIVKCFGKAAQILAAAGIDGVELHGHEGYLLDQFATKIWNKRTDKYGGDLAGRLRFPTEVLSEIKQNVGKDFHVQYRFGLKHYIKGLNMAALPGEKFEEAGRDIQEGLEMAKMLEDAGFDALHVDAGCYDSWYWPHPPGYQKHGFIADMAAAVKKVVRIPVITVGRLEIPELAERILQQGDADIVAFGRGLLADPLWVKKVEKGQPEKIRPCIGCFDGCMGRVFYGRPLSCAVNPTAGRERTYAIEKAVEARRVLIVGGGVAGLEAARTAARRGHKVVLYEKVNRLGGNLIAASTPPFKKDIERLLRWYESEVQNLGIDIRLESEVTSNLIQSEKVDVIIIATGADPIIPSIPEVTGENIATATDVLLGRKNVGDKIVVVGGGLVGCETALWLAQKGKDVTIVEMLEDLMGGRPPVTHMTRLMVLDMLKYHKVKIMTCARFVGISRGDVVIEAESSEKENLQADTVVLALGLSPNKKLYHDLLGSTPNLYLIGDAREARNIMGAIWDAYEVARAI